MVENNKDMTPELTLEPNLTGSAAAAAPVSYTHLIESLILAQDERWRRA